MSDGCQNYDKGQMPPRTPKSEPAVRFGAGLDNEKFGKQSSEVWKKLAQVCASNSMRFIKQKLKIYDCKSLDDAQVTIIHAAIYADILVAQANVAEEAMKGEDVSGAFEAAK